MARGPLPLDRVTAFVGQVLDATEALHRRGGRICGLHPGIIRVIEDGERASIAISSAGVHRDQGRAGDAERGGAARAGDRRDRAAPRRAGVADGQDCDRAVGHLHDRRAGLSDGNGAHAVQRADAAGAAGRDVRGAAGRSAHPASRTCRRIRPRRCCARCRATRRRGSRRPTTCAWRGWRRRQASVRESEIRRHTGRGIPRSGAPCSGGLRRMADSADASSAMGTPGSNTGDRTSQSERRTMHASASASRGALCAGRNT